MKSRTAKPEEHMYDIAIVGGGVSGTALLYILSRYTDIQRIALIEKYDSLGTVNSAPENNSQTLHVGDIETNYSIDKARQVYTAAMMIPRYAAGLPSPEATRIIRRVGKMVLGIGEKESALLEQRFAALSAFIPGLELLGAEEIAAREPAVMRGRSRETVRAIAAAGYAVDYGALARSLGDRADRARAHVRLGEEVLDIARDGAGYKLTTSRGTIRARLVVFNTDAHSLRFAKRLGLGREFSLIPIAGTFYFTPSVLNGKVYRVQDPRMPFAAIHGDPDLTREGVTRWGPTARLFPALEARKLASVGAYFRSSGLHRLSTWISFATILLDPIRFWYLVRNVFYELPFIGVWALLPHLRAIVPTIRVRDIRRARGYGGMRLQRVDTRTHELLLGEGKIVGENIIFNMSPSPGASVCLYNAMRDADTIAQLLPDTTLDMERLLSDLCITKIAAPTDVSLPDTYAS